MQNIIVELSGDAMNDDSYCRVLGRTAEKKSEISIRLEFIRPLDFVSSFLYIVTRVIQEDEPYSDANDLKAPLQVARNYREEEVLFVRLARDIEQLLMKTLFGC